MNFLIFFSYCAYYLFHPSQCWKIYFVNAVYFTQRAHVLLSANNSELMSIQDITLNEYQLIKKLNSDNFSSIGLWTRRVYNPFAGCSQNRFSQVSSFDFHLCLVWNRISDLSVADGDERSIKHYNFTIYKQPRDDYYRWNTLLSKLT